MMFFKFVSLLLLLSNKANAGSKNEMNHEFLSKDLPNILGSSNQARKHQKRENLVRASPPKEEFEFEPAMPLEAFKNVDPKHFEWVNPGEIVPGGTTCGFLKADLGTLPGVAYPIVKVYVCVRFAANQPAPRGNIAVHCGGPGSLSSCVYDMADGVLGSDNAENYNIISFDQRGMGRSEPTFIVNECSTLTYDPQYLIYFIDYTEETSIRAAAKVYKERALKCWAHEDFHLEVQTDDGVKTFHFLEYSGTRQLAEDIERVRVLFGNQKLSIYGISYGTKVMGTYATVFSEHVNLMVLDGNDDSNTDIVQNADDIARSINQRMDYFIASCDITDESCNVDDMRGCIKGLNTIILANKENVKASYGMSPSQVQTGLIGLLYAKYDTAQALCDAAKTGDFAAIKKIIDDNIDDSTVQGRQFFDIDSASKPTSGDSNTWPFPQYNEKSSTIPQDLVTGQDYAFGAYDEDLYVRTLMELNEKYPGAGTQAPVSNVRQWYSACYFFPNISPLAPIGDPNLKGIIAGQIYDPWTPYIWTQKMRENFKVATLLTSRSVNHGLNSALKKAGSDTGCLDNIQRYLQTGVIDFSDGTVCASSSIGKSCNIEEIITGGLCSGQGDDDAYGGYDDYYYSYDYGTYYYDDAEPPGSYNGNMVADDQIDENAISANRILRRKRI